MPLSDEEKAILKSCDSFLQSPRVFPELRNVSEPMDARAFSAGRLNQASVRQGLQVPVAFTSTYGGKSPGHGRSRSRVRERGLLGTAIFKRHSGSRALPCDTFVTL